MTGDDTSDEAYSNVFTRRRFVSTTTATGGALATGSVAAQSTEEDDGGGGGGSAVNVGTGDTIEDADEVTFDERMPLGELAQLFIEFDTAEHPVVGTDIEFDGVVLNTVTEDSARTTVGRELDWSEFEWEGSRILTPLVEPFAWVPGSTVSLDSDFYQEYQLLRVAGTTEADQRFYDRYGFVPYVWCVAPSSRTVRPGTTVNAVGTVNYAGSDTSDIDFGGASGAYLNVTNLSESDQLTTLSESTSAGETASFLGTQLRDTPQLTTEQANLDYSYGTEYPRPGGGSIVSHEGNVESNDLDDSGSGSASMETTRQDILVGDTRPGSWDSSGSDESGDAQFSNTVAVIDKSGSMGQSDTVAGDSRVAVAKQSTKSLVDFVGNGNTLGVVAFDNTSQTVSSLQSLTEDNRSAIKQDVDSLFADGGTDIGDGLQAALDMLRGTSGSKSIILLSDGESSYPDNVVPELRSLGVTVYTIGMGSSADESLLRRIANETGGQSALRPQPGQIRQVFQTFSISAQNLSNITSKRAELTEGDTVTGSATVDGSCDEVQFSLSYPGSTITLQPETPDGNALSESDGVTRRVGETSEIWTVEQPQTGEWSFSMTGEQLDRPEEATTEVSADSPIDAQLFIDDFHYEQTGMFRVELKATNGRERYTGGEVTMTATNGDTTEEIQLRDDRGGPDPVANDGIYTGYFHPSSSGEYEFTASITGGSVSDLQRDFTRRLSVDEVVDPIRPYREREPIEEGTPTGQSESALLALLRQYGPLGGGAVVVLALLGALLSRIRGGSADDEGEAAAGGEDDGETEEGSGEDADADEGGAAEEDGAAGGDSDDGGADDGEAEAGDADSADTDDSEDGDAERE